MILPTLADFFFIAGLEGNEPAIVHAWGRTTSSSASKKFRTDLAKEASVLPVQETIIEESLSSPASPTTTDVINTQLETNVIRDDIRPTSSFSYDSPSVPAKAPVTHFSFDFGTDAHEFEDVIAKFASERDEFVSTLSPPTISIPPLRATSPYRQSTLFEEEDDLLLELQTRVGERAPSPLRPRQSIREVIADLTRRTSRTGTIRRTNTIRFIPPLVSKVNSSIETKFNALFREL
jgi:hypothetical protein